MSSTNQPLPDLPPSFERTVTLVQLAQNGDRTARDAILARYLPRVGEMAALYMGRKLRDLGELDDLVQDAMLRAIRSIDDFEERTEGTFQAYMATIVRHCVIDAHRHASAAKRDHGRLFRAGDSPASGFAMHHLASPAPTPSGLAHARELDDRIESARLQLRPRYREILGLRDVLELDYQEICEVMSLQRQSTARSLYLRAKRALQKLAGL